MPPEGMEKRRGSFPSFSMPPAVQLPALPRLRPDSDSSPTAEGVDARLPEFPLTCRPGSRSISSVAPRGLCSTCGRGGCAWSPCSVWWSSRSPARRAPPGRSVDGCTPPPHLPASALAATRPRTTTAWRMRTVRPRSGTTMAVQDGGRATIPEAGKTCPVARWVRAARTRPAGATSPPRPFAPRPPSRSPARFPMRARCPPKPSFPSRPLLAAS
jgi:hypothetical protein